RILRPSDVRQQENANAIARAAGPALLRARFRALFIVTAFALGERVDRWRIRFEPHFAGLAIQEQAHAVSDALGRIVQAGNVRHTDRASENRDVTHFPAGLGYDS